MLSDALRSVRVGYASCLCRNEADGFSHASQALIISIWFSQHFSVVILELFKSTVGLYVVVASHNVAEHYERDAQGSFTEEVVRGKMQGFFRRDAFDAAGRLVSHLLPAVRHLKGNGHC